MITTNQLARGIKFKTVWGLEAQVRRGRALFNTKKNVSKMFFFAPMLIELVFAYISNDFNKKKILTFFFGKTFFLILLEYSETYFDLVIIFLYSKYSGSYLDQDHQIIDLVINDQIFNLVIYDDILINSLRILSTKLTISHKIKIAKTGKLFLNRFQKIA